MAGTNQPTTHQIWQDILAKNPDLRQHFGHLDNYWNPIKPMPIQNAEVASTQPVELPKNDEKESKGTETQLKEKEAKLEPVQPSIVVNVPPAEITVNVPEQEPPMVNVTMPEIKFPKQEAPQVTVNPPEVTVNVQKEQQKEEPIDIKVIRDENQRIKQIIETFKDGSVVETNVSGL